MQNSKVNVAAVLMAAALCLTHAVPGWSEPVENKRKVYVGTMVAVPLAQDLHHQTSFTVLDNELTGFGRPRHWLRPRVRGCCGKGDFRLRGP